MRNLSSVLSTRSLLIAGALFGMAASACDWGPKKIGDETLSSGDETCAEGESKPADDGCNTCTCVDGGWACTEIGCADTDSEPPNPTSPGDECVDGEVKDAGDGCNTCTCFNGGWGCTLKACEETEGPKTSDGEPNDTEGECVDGDKKDAPDGCNTCYCDQGQWSCTEIGCVDTDGGLPQCGDGVLDGGEECDDGNLTSGDGCSASCVLEGQPDGAIQVCGPLPIDPFQYNAAAIIGDELHVQIEHGGGCEAHVYTYCWTGAFDLSEPVTAGTFLAHDSNGDLCDALLTLPLVYDLTPLKQEWQALHNQQSGTILVHLDNFAGSPLTYSF